MTILQFPRDKWPPGFGAVGINIDIEQLRSDWASIFLSMEIALRLCDFDHLEAEKLLRAIDASNGFLDKTAADLANSIYCLEALIAMMNAATARLEILKARAARQTKMESK